MRIPRILRFALMIGLIGLIGLTVSCGTTTDGYGHLERDPESLGKRTGREDAMAGLGRNHARHLRDLHPDADEDDFEDAYDEAYDEAQEKIAEREEREEEEREEVREREYAWGHRVGEQDRDQGLSRSPFRHQAAKGFSAAWVDGYQDGWNEER